jgi:alkanesulfonate monooxygenase SsuD/methylene tetrahydromethanopterin reductase-like flavin-dependent oxidoreductase (luciferase family)
MLALCASIDEPEANPSRSAMTEPHTDATPRIGIVARPQLPPTRLRAVARQADELGLDDVWIWEDCFLEGGLTSATALLAATDSVRVGLGLMPVPLRNPALAAMEIATVAALFPGRFAPAVGHGVLEWMGQVGARVDSPLTLLREWATAVRALLHGETVDVDGRYVRLDRVTLDWPPAVPPPLMVGGRGPKTLGVAGELADGTIVDSATTPDDVRAALRHISPTAGHEVVVYVLAGSGDAARTRLTSEGAWRSIHPDAMAIGDAERVAAVVSEYVDAGATTIALQPAATEPDVEGFLTLASAVRHIVTGGAPAHPE